MQTLKDGSQFNFRSARPDDCGLILRLIHELAVYEKLEHEAVGSETDLRRHLFGERPFAEVLLGERNGETVAFALFFHNYSTFLTKPGIYLEDLFVQPSFRGLGLGKLMLTELERIARARGCGRLEWAVLNWNKPAIDFYESLGAKAQSEWTVYRMGLSVNGRRST